METTGRLWRALAAALLAALALACGGVETERAGPARCVVLITCDTLRADRLGVYGCARPTSPELDRFARDAVVFEHAFASAPMTTPSLSSLFTGLLPSEIGVEPGNLRALSESAETLPERFSAAGISTAAVVSNWVLRASRSGAENPGLRQGFDDYDDRMTHREKNRESFERVAGETTDAALAWLAKADRAGDERFFLWVHYQDPHGPYTPPNDVLARFERTPEELASDPTRVEIGLSNLGHGQIPAYQALDLERRPDVYRDRYDAEVAYFDRELGRLLDGLRASGAWDDALVVLTADHGESLGEHGYWFCHGENVHAEQVRVPLLVRFPNGRTPAWVTGSAGAARCERVVGHLDLWPTLLEAFGLPHGDRRGTSLFDERGPAEDRVLVQSVVPASRAPGWTAISAGRHRLMWREGASERELYDVALDPGEMRDLALEQPELVARLLERYREFERSLVKAPSAALPAHALDREDRDALQKLGYVGDGDE